MNKKGILSIFLLLLLACTDNDSDCYDVSCTLDFRTIMLSIHDTDATPVALDSFEITAIASGIDITRVVPDYEFEEMQLEGVYPLFGDEFTAIYENTEIDINFKGIINNEVVVSENYRVGADCCHIYFVEGNRDIIID